MSLKNPLVFKRHYGRKSTWMTSQDSILDERGERMRRRKSCRRSGGWCWLVCISRLASPDYFTPPPIQRLPDNSLSSSSQSGFSYFHISSNVSMPQKSKVLIFLRTNVLNLRPAPQFYALPQVPVFASSSNTFWFMFCQ